MNILHIDTSDNKKITLVLTVGEKKNRLEKETTSHKSQILLPLIVELLKRHDLDFYGLTEITVNTGPGSFTGLRVGVAVANALGFTLHIPVNGQTSPVEPTYS